MGNNSDNKDEQIKLLLNEVKGIRNKIQDILTFEGRIDNYEEFIKLFSQLIDYLDKNEKEEIKIICEKFNYLMENYELNGIRFYNRIMQEIFGIENEELEEEGKDEIEETYYESNNYNENSINSNKKYD